MNALEKIAEKDENGETLTPIEMAIYCGMMLEAAEDLAAMQARIEKLENVAKKLANIIQWAVDDEEDFIYSTEGMAAIAELDALKGKK